MDEYIKRTDALKVLHGDAVAKYPASFVLGLAAAADEVRKIPAADVMKVVRGHWIKHGNEKKCSVCGFIYYSNNDEWNGCPNCLSVMDEKRRDSR